MAAVPTASQTRAREGSMVKPRVTYCSCIQPRHPATSTSTQPSSRVEKITRSLPQEMVSRERLVDLAFWRMVIAARLPVRPS